MVETFFWSLFWNQHTKPHTGSCGPKCLATKKFISITLRSPLTVSPGLVSVTQVKEMWEAECSWHSHWDTCRVSSSNMATPWRGRGEAAFHNQRTDKMKQVLDISSKVKQMVLLLKGSTQVLVLFQKLVSILICVSLILAICCLEPPLTYTLE